MIRVKVSVEHKQTRNGLEITYYVTHDKHKKPVLLIVFSGNTLYFTLWNKPILINTIYELIKMTEKEFNGKSTVVGVEFESMDENTVKEIITYIKNAIGEIILRPRKNKFISKNWSKKTKRWC